MKLFRAVLSKEGFDDRDVENIAKEMFAGNTCSLRNFIEGDSAGRDEFVSSRGGDLFFTMNNNNEPCQQRWYVMLVLGVFCLSQFFLR